MRSRPRDLAGVERRAVDVDVQLGTTGGLLGERAGGAPHVLADADAHLHATDDVQLVRIVVVAGREVAGLVEHGVVGQQPLAVGADHLAAGAHRGCVVEVAVGVDEADHGSAATSARRQLAEGDQVVGHEPRLQHQVFGRVAGDRQLGERDDVAPGRLGLVVRGADLGHVAVEVADRRVDLGQGDAQSSHSLRLSVRHNRQLGPSQPVHVAG